MVERASVAETLEGLRSKISTAEALHSVVRTMKALASVSIRQFERAAESLEDYTRTTELGLQILMRHYQGARPPELLSSGRPVAIILGSDQGMVGPFNNRIADFAAESITAQDQHSEVAVFAVGVRIIGLLEDAGLSVHRFYETPGSAQGITSSVEVLLLALEELRAEEDVGQVDIYHNRPGDGSSFEPHRARLLPLDAEWLTGLAERDWDSTSLPTHFMEPEALWAALAQEHVFAAMHRGFAESLASENAARLAAMQAAEKNVDERLQELHSRYNRQRQESITSELLDILTGSEAVSQEDKASAS